MNKLSSNFKQRIASKLELPVEERAGSQHHYLDTLTKPFRMTVLELADTVADFSRCQLFHKSHDVAQDDLVNGTATERDKEVIAILV